MKKTLAILALLATTLTATHAQEQIKWLRASSISPDAKTIAFEYKGDIYTVGINGGEARRLTTHRAYDGYPLFSPDGKWIAFTSERYGSMDVFIISPNGGKPIRLTTNSASETLQGWLDNTHVLYTSNLFSTPSDISFPGSYAQVYSVDIQAGRPSLFSAIPMEDISVNRSGQLLYHNNKGYEDHWRKRHRSPICRDIYLTQAEGKRTFRKLNTDTCEHRTPIWAPDGKSYYFTSEADGTINIYKTNPDTRQTTQLTHYKDYPVRYLTSAADGTLCYSWDGEIYTLKEGQKPHKLTVSVNADNEDIHNQPQTLSHGAGYMATNKDAKEFAFVVKGEVYTTTADYATSRRITSTPQTEKQPSLSPDGRTLVYASERNNTWGIYAATLTNPADKGFTYATDITESPLITGTEAYTNPVYSPDGTKIAYIANKTEIRVYDIKTKKSTVVMPAHSQFAYTDGAPDFEWSPDSKWILTEYLGPDNWNSPDIAVISIDGKQIHNLTNSGYSDSNPRWALGGKAVTFISDRAGYRSHGSWGSERDAYIIYLDREAYALNCKMNKEERFLYEERKKQAKELREKADSVNAKKDKKNDKDEKSDKNDKATAADSTLKLDFADCDKRMRRLTGNSSNLAGGYLTPDGKKFFYLTSFEGGLDLWLHDLEDNSTRIFKKGFGGGQFFPDAKGENLFVCNGSMSKLNLASGSSTNIPFSVEYTHDNAADMAFQYDHLTNQINKRFVDTAFHGINFDKLARHYATFLPYIDNYRDFSELGSELLGELNCSHTGLKYRASVSAPATAVLGAFYDDSYTGDGLKILEIIKGSPLDVLDSTVKAGHIVKQINHQPIKAGKDYFPLLTGKAGKQTLLTIADDKGNDYDIYVKPITYGQQNDLLYTRWTERCAKTVADKTNGQVGYIHVKAMNSESFRHTYSELLGKYRNCKAVIIDERHNGGGWLHNDLATLLSGRQYMTFESRGQKLGIEPFTQWTKPSCLLITENCYSNANGFPYTYKALGIGKLIGSPMAGTMTAVWWENMADGRLTLGIPEIYCIATNGKPLENQTLYPDIDIHNTPEDLISGHDSQLLRAIDEMK